MVAEFRPRQKARTMSQAADYHSLPRLDCEVIRFAPFAILVLDEQNVVEIANAEAVRILAGSLELTEIVGSAVDTILPGVDFSQVGCKSLFRIVAEGTQFALELQCVKVDQHGRCRMIVYVSEFGGNRQREILLEKEASTDELSGLANRRKFQRTMESNQHLRLSLALVDIDQFKLINDNHGHPVGDDVIQLIGNLLQETFSDNAILVSRMSGDEFSVLFETVDAQLIVDALRDCCGRIDRSGVWIPEFESKN